MRCAGKKGGQSKSPARLASMTNARSARWSWKAGERVTARLKRFRTWEGEIIRISKGVRGNRLLVVTVTWSSRAAQCLVRVPYEATIKEHQVCRVRGFRAEEVL
jgi:hypothetical protein